MLFLLLLGVSLIWKIDETPFNDSEVYKSNMRFLETMELETSDSDLLLVGWAKENITPSTPSTMVGYTPRGPHENVHDSLFVRSVVFDNGVQEVALISIDLLIFPPRLREALSKEIVKLGVIIDQTYLSATHTHTSIGGWNNSFAGEFIAGTFEQEVIDFLVDKIIRSIRKAQLNKARATLGFEQFDANEFVENRLDKPNGTVDSWLRLIKITKETGEIGSVISFSAHATNINRGILSLSGDYPSSMIQYLEKNKKIDFAVFCSGMVASHRVPVSQIENFERVDELGMRLSELVLNGLDSINMKQTAKIGITQVPVLLPDSQLRISKKLRLRDWAFKRAFGELEASITLFRLGDIVMFGMPCDFSGEVYVNSLLDSLAKSKELEVMVTSFNGKYIGYITEDKHYQTKTKEEVRALNWVGPYKGQYFTEILENILMKVE